MPILDPPADVSSEVWKPVNLFGQLFEASNLGRVRKSIGRKGTPCLRIAKMFGVSDRAIMKIRDGLTWAHVA